LDDLSSDRGLKIAFDTKRTLAEVWISVAKEYPQISAAAMNALLSFGTTSVKGHFLHYHILKRNTDQD